MKKPRTARAIGLAALSSLAACRCGSEPSTSRSFAELAIVVTNPDGSRSTTRDAVFDFGSVFMGQTVTGALAIQNLGRGELSVTAVEQVDGDPAFLGADPVADPVFEAPLTETLVLGASETRDLPLSFHALTDSAQPFVDHRAHLLLRSQGPRPGEETAAVELRGRAVSGLCEVPPVLDFGNVVRGTSESAALTLGNPTELDANATASDPQSATGDHAVFGFLPGTPHGSFTLAKASSAQLGLSFSPTEARPYQASFKVRPSAQCPEVTVQLVGTGVENVLQWDPASIDFKYISPGKELSRTVRFVNSGNFEVVISKLQAAPADFQVTTALPATGSAIAPKGGVFDVTVRARAAALGPSQGQLSFATTVAKQPSGVIPLKYFGGGPDIAVNPAAVHFGPVAFMAGVVPPASQKRKLTVKNVGTTVVDPADPTASNLKLGKPGGGGAYGPPYVSLRPLNVDTSVSEFEVTLPASYNPAVGLEATAAKNAIDLSVVVTPTSAAKKEVEITLYSNDSDEPELKVVASADPVVYPPCNFSVVPALVNFGLVSPPAHADLTVSIANQSAADRCLVSGVEIDPSSDPAFVLPGGTIPSRELAPLEVLQVLVRAQPQGPIPTGGAFQSLSGKLAFQISDPARPRVSVDLLVTVGQACLVMTPSNLSFGTVQTGCRSPSRTFSVYNVCPVAVTLHSFDLLLAAGQPAGGPNCPGPGACPEFSFTSVPAVPPGGLLFNSGAAPLTFQVRYAPLDVGSDVGAVAVVATYSGQTATFVVSLAGSGDSSGVNRDEFVQTAGGLADVLLTVDNSCSMAIHQQSLANNFSEFIQYAATANVDYHLAVTTTDDQPGLDEGRFRGDAANPTVLTRQTPDLVTKFQQKVNVGTNGSSEERGLSTSLKALTAPLIANENAGFLRDGANLAVVVITDVNDQSPGTTTFFYDSFLNIKGFNNANLFTFNGVIALNPSPPAPCTHEAPDDGRYPFLINQTSGVLDEICTQDWAATLRNIGATAFGFRTRFFLNAVPDLIPPRKIQVQVDGMDVPEIGPQGQVAWTYDFVSNSVNFTADFVPEAGSTVSISYPVFCN